jgi:uncharacterized protein (TIGR02145 family)
MAQYIHLFDTASEFNEAYNGSSYEEPWVSYTEEDQEVHYNKESVQHDYVEIGGIKWATMNLGATAVTDFGDYYAWGDTNGYSENQVGTDKNFIEGDYIYGPISWYSSPDYGTTKYNTQDNLTTLQASDDAITQAWGGNWRLPTTSEWQALGSAVNSVWTNDYQGSGTAGLVCTDKTDSAKVLFFPAHGGDCEGAIGNTGHALYWSSSVKENEVCYARFVYLADTETAWDDYSSRFCGYSLRGILDE